MNDTELDEILDTWTAPPAPASLRQNVQSGFAGYAPKISPSGRKSLVAGFIFGTLALLFVVGEAFPGSPPPSIPYTVDSEYIRYAADGAPSIDMYTTSYLFNGAETIRSRSIPGRPFVTAIGRALDAAIPLWSRLMTRFTVDPRTLERLRRRIPHTVGVIDGCDASCMLLEHHYFARAGASAGTACLDGPIVGRETILNYPATAVQPNFGNRRLTLWVAPDLGCFALRITTEEKQPNGTFRLVNEKRALRVNLKP